MSSIINTIQAFKDSFPSEKIHQNVQLCKSSLQDLINYGIYVMERLESVGQDRVSSTIIPVFTDLLFALGESEILTQPAEVIAGQKGSRYDSRILFPTSGKYDVQVYLHILISVLIARVQIWEARFLLAGRKTLAKALAKFISMHGQQNSTERGLKLVDTVYQLAPSSVYEKIQYFSVEAKQDFTEEYDTEEYDTEESDIEDDDEQKDIEWESSIDQDVSDFRTSIKLTKQDYQPCTLNTANIWTLLHLVIDGLEYSERTLGETDAFKQVKALIFPFVAAVRRELEDLFKTDVKFYTALITKPFVRRDVGQITSKQHGKTRVDPRHGTKYGDKKCGLHTLIMCLLNRINHLREIYETLSFESLDSFLERTDTGAYMLVNDVFQAIGEAIEERLVDGVIRIAKPVETDKTYGLFKVEKSSRGRRSYQTPN
jgi:hypothetical protein